MAVRSVDHIDRKILATLQRQGRLPNNQLAEAVGLSPAPCLRRLRRLEAAGIIRAYAALLHGESVGVGVTAFTRVSLERHDPGRVQAFERAVQRIPEVLECHSVTGEADYLLRVVARDLRSYADLLTSKLMPLPGVTSVNSALVLREIKSTTALPLAYAGED